MEEVQIPYGGGSDDSIGKQEKAYYSEKYSDPSQLSVTVTRPGVNATHQRQSSERTEERNASFGSDAHERPNKSSKECGAKPVDGSCVEDGTGRRKERLGAARRY